jgi:hypothetical protein
LLLALSLVLDFAEGFAQTESSLFAFKWCQSRIHSLMGTA